MSMCTVICSVVWKMCYVTDKLLALQKYMNWFLSSFLHYFYFYVLITYNYQHVLFWCVVNFFLDTCIKAFSFISLCSGSIDWNGCYVNRFSWLSHILVGQNLHCCSCLPVLHASLLNSTAISFLEVILPFFKFIHVFFLFQLKSLKEVRPYSTICYEILLSIFWKIFY